MVVAARVQSGSQSIFQTRYDNFIGGKWVPPVKGKYSENLSPITGKSICQIPKSSAEDVELALTSVTSVTKSVAELPSTTNAFPQ